MKNPGATYTVGSHAESHRVSDETACQDLMGLEQQSYLVRAKVGKRFCWTPAPDLARCLGHR